MNLCQQGDEFKLKAEEHPHFQINCLHHATSVARDLLYVCELVSLLVQAHDPFCAHSSTYRSIGAKKKLEALNRNQEESVSLNVDRIVSLHCKRITRRYPHSEQLTYVQGIQIEITMDTDHGNPEDHYLFMCVLNQLLQHYCPVNSFFELCVVSTKDGRRQSWQPQFQ